MRIVFRLESPVTIGSLQIEFSYDGLPGYFAGDNDQVLCSSELAAIAAYNNLSANREIAAGWIAMDGFTGPIDVASCIAERYGPRGSLAFDVEVVDAATTDLTQVFDVVVTAEER